MRLDEWVRYAHDRLVPIGIESAKLEAQMLAAHVLLVDRTWIVAHPDADFPELAGESVLHRRLSREPLAYILGWREFYGRKFIVGPGVLIPRHETEVLVEAALEIGQPGARVLDVGTGSGCIAITLSLERPDWKVTGSEISRHALDIAERNSSALSANVQWVEGDGCNISAEIPFDLIVSNPPYVAHGDLLSPEIRDFEPELALYATGEGLDFYRRLASECASILDPNGMILMELGADQLGSVRSIFESHKWYFVKSWKDLLGVERVVAFQRLGPT